MKIGDYVIINPDKPIEYSGCYRSAARLVHYRDLQIIGEILNKHGHLCLVDFGADSDNDRSYWIRESNLVEYKP